MTQFSHSASVNEEGKGHQGLRTPLDGLILFIAGRVGGSKAKEVERFLKFAIVGSIGAVIDLGTSNLLMFTVLDPRDRVSVLIAATISFIAAVLSNFTWNRYWTYPDSRSRPLRQQLALFAIVSVTGWIGRTVWIGLSQPFMRDIAGGFVAALGLPLDEVRAAQLGATFAILIGIFVVMIWNFFVNRYWTYNDVD